MAILDKFKNGYRGVWMPWRSSTSWLLYGLQTAIVYLLLMMNIGNVGKFQKAIYYKAKTKVTK